MKVTVLGSGSAYGVPFAGNEWGACDPNNPKNRRTTASILIEKEGSQLLVDMSPDFREQSIRHLIKDVDGVFFTHPHGDHIAGMFHLPIFMYHYKDKNLSMFADRFTRIEAEQVWWYMFDKKIEPEFTGEGRPLWHEIREGYAFKAGNIEATPFLQNHGRFNSQGLRVGDFVYSTDVHEFPEESHKFLKDIDVWVVDCNCKTNTDKSHGYVDKCIQWFNEFKPKRMILTHLDCTVDFDEVSAMLPDRMELAYDGMEIEL